LFKSLKSGLAKVFANQKIDQNTIQDFEDLLITSDVDAETSELITTKLGNEKFSNAPSLEEIQSSLSKIINEIVSKNIKKIDYRNNTKPYVILMVGVNGSGKTTTIAKLANQFQQEKKNVLLVAADTFRAAAAEQLNKWADKIGTDFIRDDDKSDPASVVFKSIEYANKNNIDVVIIDTAGRLQNKTDLMEQLGKIDRVLKKHDETLPHDSIISIDATTGQNALKQVEEFNKFTKITGIIMTKFDSNAAGGTLVSISNKTKIPILAFGSGEQISDLIDFDPEQFSNNFIKN
jgi:fused signal recognition particle receptor